MLLHAHPATVDAHPAFADKLLFIYNHSLGKPGLTDSLRVGGSRKAHVHCAKTLVDVSERDARLGKHSGVTSEAWHGVCGRKRVKTSLQRAHLIDELVLTLLGSENLLVACLRNGQETISHAVDKVLLQELLA